MSLELAKIIAEYALPYPIDSDEPENYQLSQDHVPGVLQSEADVRFGAAQGNDVEAVYVVDVDDYEQSVKS